jgi:hypothetical protein
VTSNYILEELLASQNQARIDAFKRRFTVVHITWIYMGRCKMLECECPDDTIFRPPKDIWWRSASSDSDNEFNPFPHNQVSLR